MSGKRLVAPKAGDPIRESFLRDLVARVERLEAITARGERGFIDNTTGYFPFTKQLPIRQFELEEDLYRGNSADAKMLSWSQADEEWVEGTGGTKTIYGDFANGYWFAGEMVNAVPMGGRYYAIGSRMDWVEFRNDSAETIPSHAVVKVTGTSEDGASRIFVLAEQPDEFGGQTCHFITGNNSVEPGEYGWCSSAATPTLARYTSGAGIDEANTTYGPVDNAWVLAPYVGGFRSLGTPRNGRILVVREPLRSLRVVLDEDLTSSGSADAKPYYYDGSSWTENEPYTVTVHEAIGITEPVTSGTVCWCTWDVTGKQWIVTAAECNGGT